MKSGNFYKDVGTKIGKLMANHEPKSVTHSELAEITGVDRGTLTGYLNGKTKMPIEVLKKIADYFEVTADWLMDDDRSKSIKADMANAELTTGLSADAINHLNSSYTQEMKDNLSEMIQNVNFSLMMIYFFSCKRICERFEPGLAQCTSNKEKEDLVALSKSQFDLQAFDAQKEFFAIIHDIGKDMNNKAKEIAPYYFDGRVFEV